MMRRGVSLLEVLISIGVIAIGLMGVIALYPLALGQIGTGTVADRSARAGQNAIEVFTARGMAQPSQAMWFTTTTTPAVINPATPGPLLPDGANSGYLIDPMFVAFHGPTNGGGFDARFFPYYERQMIPNPLAPSSPYPQNFDPRLRRVTLRSGPTATTIMNAAQAELLFRADDDLSFELPPDRNAPPAQIFGANNTRRQYEGTISWMATLVPQLNITDTDTMPGDLYQLSIVVFDRRDSSMTMNEQNERVVNVSTFHNMGLGGGDVTLATDAADPEVLNLKPGQWLMLMATPHPYNSTSPTVPAISLFRWYRVIDTEDAVHPGTGVYTWQRDAVLQGPDWPVAYFANLPAQRPTRAVLVNNVVAVYERTVRLEKSGLWKH